MATRSLGFSLTVKGNQQTEKQLDGIKNKLSEVAAKIKEIKNTPIKLSIAFDTKSINEFLKVLDKTKTAQFNPAIQSQMKELRQEIVLLKENLETAQKELAKLKSPVLASNDIERINGHYDKLEQHAKTSAKLIGEIRPVIERIDSGNVLELAKSLASIEVLTKKLSKAKIKITSDKTLSDTTKATLLEPLLDAERALTAQKKLLKREADAVTQSFVNQANNIPDDSILGLNTKLSKLTAEYNKLSKAELESDKGKSLANDIASITNEVSQREQAIGNFRRNVGNYQSAITGLIPSLEKLQGEGIIAQRELIGIFRADTEARIEKLKAEINGLAAAYTNLGNDAAKAGERAQILDKLTNATRELASASAATNKIGSNFQQLQGKLLSVSDIVTGGLIGGGIVATLGFLKSFGQQSVQEFTEAETALAKISQQLIVTGGQSGKTAEGLKEISKQLEVATGIDGDRILNDVSSSLLRFGNIQGDVFDRAQKAAIDLSSTMGGDLAGAAAIVGKALEDPEKAIGRLAKAGVILDKETDKAVKNAIKSNDLYKAQTLILGQLENKFKGVSEGVQNSSLKNLRQLSVDFNNFKEAVGGAAVATLNSAISFFKDFGNGVLFAKAGTKETTIATNELVSSLTRENAVIKSSFEALKDQNEASEIKEKIISQLIAKYPEYLSKEKLIGKSAEDLTKLEIDLTETIKKKTFERILARAQEAASAAEDAERIRLAILKTKDFDSIGFVDRFKLIVDKTFGSSNTLDQAFEKEEKASEDRLNKLKEQNKKIADQLKQTLIQEFGAIDETKVLAVQQGKIVKQAVEDQTKDTEDAIKKLEEQANRLAELKNRIKELEASAIDNEFDRQIAETRLKADEEIKKFEDSLSKLKIKPVKSKLDEQEILALSNLIPQLEAAKDKQIQDINNSRQSVLDEATRKLYDTQDEVKTILNDISKTDFEVNLSIQKFDLEQAQRTINIEFQTNIDELNAKLAQGLISQEDFDKDSQKLEEKKLDSIAALQDNYQKEYIKALESKRDAEKKILEETADIRRRAIRKQLVLDNTQIALDQKAGKISPETASQQIAENNSKAAVQIKEINTNLSKDLIEINQTTQTEINSVIDSGVEAHQGAEQAKTAATKEETDKRKELIKQIKETSIQVFEEIADALLEIESNNSERRFEKAQTQLQHDYDNRIKLAQGNNAEITRLERERDQKLKDLERDQAKRRQKQAISEAIIQGALAIVKAFSSLGPIGGAIAAVGITASTAIQIAKIKAQTFKQGFYFNQKGRGGFTGASRAPADETGDRPIGTGIFHEDEFLATRKQTKRNPWIFDLLDKDRLRTNAGQSSTIEDDLFKQFESRKRTALYNFKQATIRPKWEIIAPVIKQTQFNIESKINIPDAQIDKIADAISSKIEQATLKGTYSGTSTGIKESTKQALRQELTKKRATA